jgi:hypothetical protein
LFLSVISYLYPGFIPELKTFFSFPLKSIVLSV